MKHKILTIFLVFLVILMGSLNILLFFINLSQKQQISSLKETLEYEKTMMEQYRVEAEENEDNSISGENSPNVITESASSENAGINSDSKKESKKSEENQGGEAAKTDYKKESQIKKVDLSKMEILEAGTVVSEDLIDRSDVSQYFQAYPISDTVFKRIYGDDRSYKTDCTVPRANLIYIKVLHYSYDGKIKVGEMIANALFRDDLLYIFQNLFEKKYQIEKMYLVDTYNADDDASVNDNNTSCFNYRTATDSDTLSYHATGCAVDINPLQNPYFRILENGDIDYDNVDADKYWDRSNNPKGRHMIDHDDLCYQLFTERGFSWGGDWDNPIDYQHFEKDIEQF